MTAFGVIRPSPPGPERADTDLNCADATGPGRFEPKSELDLNGVVEPALAKALILAAEAQRWELVEQIARELKERRETLYGKHVELATPPIFRTQAARAQNGRTGDWGARMRAASTLTTAPCGVESHGRRLEYAYQRWGVRMDSLVAVTTAIIRVPRRSITQRVKTSGAAGA